MVHQADVHAGVAAPQRLRVDPGPFQRLPGRFQQQPLLRIHHHGLTRTDPEEPGVETRGIEQERAKNMVKLIKDSKLKVQASIQGDLVRVSSAKKDTLHETIALVRKAVADIPLQFKNFRD